MTTADGSATAPAVARPGLLPVLKVVAGLFAALVLAQALLAGRGWFLDRDLIEVHGYVGQAVALVAVLQAALVFAAVGPVGGRAPIVVLSVAILLLVFVQIGLGYAGRESADAAAWHVPNGVLIFGLSTANSAMVFRLGR